MKIKLIGLLAVVVLFSPILNSFAEEVILDTDTNFKPGQVVEISGEIPDGVPGQISAIEIKNPSGETILIRTVTLDENKQYFIKFKVPKSSEVGNYDVIVNAEFIITMSWPKDSKDDIDLYVMDPAGNIVYFRDKDNGLMHLDRDDLGDKNDQIWRSELEESNRNNSRSGHDEEKWDEEAWDKLDENKKLTVSARDIRKLVRKSLINEHSRRKKKL